MVYNIQWYGNKKYIYPQYLDEASHVSVIITVAHYLDSTYSYNWLRFPPVGILRYYTGFIAIEKVESLIRILRKI